MLDRFLELAAARPEARALLEGDTGLVITREALLARARDLATELTAAGLVERDLVAIQLPNSAEFVAAFLAILLRRLVAVPIDRDAPDTEVEAILAHFGARALVYRGGISIRKHTVHAAIPAEARLVKLTSGSTGKPKGIVTSEANLIADCVSICATMDIRPTDINLGAIPFSHSYGFSNLVMPLILQGTAVVISNDYLPQSIVRLANRYDCTVVPLIPMVFEHLTSIPRGDGELAGVRTFLSAGAPLSPSTSRRFRERFGAPIHSFYGCSECGGIAYDREGAAAERGTVGQAMTGVTLSLRDARLVIRSASVALGYLHDAVTFQSFEEGTFTTDDLVEFDARGEVILAGRAGDVINTAGKKVNPREVERVLLLMDGVRQAKVYGEPAGARGEVVAAAIVADPDITREQIRAHCRSRLSTHKVPRIVKLIESIPVDERGKVRRSALELL